MTRLMGRRLWSALLGVAAFAASAEAQSVTSDPGTPAGGPTFREILSLESVGSPSISPDGRFVAFTRSIPDWDRNRSVQELWIGEAGEEPTRIGSEDDGFRGGPRWTPDGRIAFLEVGDNPPRLKLLRPDGADAGTIPLTVPSAGAYRFSPDGSTLAVLVGEAPSDRARREQEMFGPFSFRDEGSLGAHLWLQPVGSTGEARQLTAGDFSVSDFAWSPDGSEIAFVHAPDGGRNSWWKADLSVVAIGSGEVRPLVSEAGPDTRPMWSPDGSRVAFLSTFADSITNLPAELGVVPAGGGEVHVLTDDLETQANPIAWTDRGILVTALEGTENHLFRLSAESGRTTRLSGPPYLMGQVSVAADGSAIAFSARTPDRLGDIYRTDVTDFEPRPLTDMTTQAEAWDLGTREVVDWIGPGGVRIEGVLHKPSDYDPDRRYPLLVIVHGGPRAVSSPALQLSSGVYPVTHFLRKGALVLQPNYRGSTGYGGAFRQLHRRGVGWGDAGDVEAGAAHLVAEGIVDADRIGVMGWSYGGFISAYLTAQSKAFRAVSVGAGISDWRTHYAWEPVSWTTRFYSFDAAPWEDPNAYDVASPITYINNASTPTLIQHVDGDPVVTVLNAYELQHALQDLGVENRFVIYPGQSHGVVPLRQRLGALWHNWQWFLRHIWNEEVELPLER